MTAHEIPGMVDVSHEAHAAGLASGMRDWRVTYELGVVVVLRAASIEDVMRRAGAGLSCPRLAGAVVLMVEDLTAAEVV